MINRDEILKAIKPFVMQWIEKRTGAGTVPARMSIEGGDELVRVTSSDDNADYLNSKVTAGSGITTTVLNPGSTETLEIAVNTTAIDHGGRAGLGDDDHTQYLNTTRHAAIDHTGLVHAAVTVVDTGTIDFTLTGQQITASVIPTGIKLDDLGAPDDNTDLNASASVHGLLPKLSNVAANFLNGAGSWATPDHGSIGGLGDDDHTQYFLVNGSRDMAGHIIPAATDIYDLGSSSRLWRKGWLSELDTVVFAENTIILLGGWFWVTKDQGTLAANVAALDTTIDFGKTMTPGDFIALKSSTGSEYMEIGTLVSGTVYNVTRDLDGSGANAWVAGAPFAVLGQTGNGRIEFNAYDTPRISILTQGATYNATTELMRLGDLNGSFGVSSEAYGMGIGDYSAGNFLRYDPTNGFKLACGDGNLVIDDNGISIAASATSSAAVNNKYAFNQSGTEISYLGAAYGVGTRKTELKVDAGGQNGSIWLEVEGTDAAKAYSVTLTATDGTDQSYLTVNKDGISIDGPVSFTSSGGSIFVPLTAPLTSTSWDGDARSTTSKTVIDLSSVFGAPAGIKGVALKISANDSGSGSTNCFFGVAPNNTADQYALVVKPYGSPNDTVVHETGVVPCDSSGDIYYQCVASGTGTLDVTIQIWGYFI